MTLNTICKFPDIDIYLLYFIDLTTIANITSLSREQYQIIHEQKFIKELYALMNRQENVMV